MSREQRQDEEKEGRRSLNDIVLRAGAIATALGAIIGLVTVLWPDSPARLVATLDRLEIDKAVALSEFTARQRVADARADPSLGAARDDGAGPALAATHLSLAAAALAQAPDEGAGPDVQAPDGDGSPSEGSEGQIQPEDAQPPPAESKGDPSPSEAGDGKSRHSGGASSEIRPADELETKIAKTAPVPDGCSVQGSDMVCESGGSDGEGFVETLLPSRDIEKSAGGETVANAKALLAVLKNTRARSVSSGRTEPMGVTLSFDLELEGFSGSKAMVRWSLFDAGARKRVPRDWLVNRRALELQPEAAFDRESSEFWVPLPKRRGPFFVRLTVYNEEGERLTFADSKSFR